MDHQFVYPRVRELDPKSSAAPAPPESEARAAGSSQRALVTASLIARPDHKAAQRQR
jgi:hypothetical protein